MTAVFSLLLIMMSLAGTAVGCWVMLPKSWQVCEESELQLQSINVWAVLAWEYVVAVEWHLLCVLSFCLLGHAALPFSTGRNIQLSDISCCLECLRDQNKMKRLKVDECSNNFNSNLLLIFNTRHYLVLAKTKDKLNLKSLKKSEKANFFSSILFSKNSSQCGTDVQR